MTDRDKFLTESMEIEYRDIPDSTCEKCGFIFSTKIDFSTWPSFGLLWGWAQKQEWFEKFLEHFANNFLEWGISEGERIAVKALIHPSRFADALYEYLKERK